MRYTYFYDIGLSFAGEYREHVGLVRTQLENLGYKVFYDNDHISELVGEDILEYFRDVYTNRCSFCVAFISDEYLIKKYTKHEISIIEERIIRDSVSNFLMPVVMNPKNHEDLASWIGRINYSTPEETAEKIHNHICSVVEHRRVLGLKKLSDMILFQLSGVLLVRGLITEIFEDALIVRNTNQDDRFIVKPDDTIGYSCISVFHYWGEAEMLSCELPLCLIFVEDSARDMYSVRFMDRTYEIEPEKIDFKKMIEMLADFFKGIIDVN